MKQCYHDAQNPRNFLHFELCFELGGVAKQNVPVATQCDAMCTGDKQGLPGISVMRLPGKVLREITWSHYWQTR